MVTEAQIAPDEHPMVRLFKNVATTVCIDNSTYTDPMVHVVDIIYKKYPTLTKRMVATHAGLGIIFEFAGVREDIYEIWKSLMDVVGLAGLTVKEYKEYSTTLHDGNQGVEMHMVIATV